MFVFSKVINCKCKFDSGMFYTLGLEEITLPHLNKIIKYKSKQCKGGVFEFESLL